MARESILKSKSFEFSIRIVHLYKYLISEHKEYEIGKQILKSGTAIGALIREAEHAESRKDFVHKLQIGLKEANETNYWLDLLRATNFLSESLFNSLKKDCEAILKILIASLITLKAKMKLEK